MSCYCLQLCNCLVFDNLSCSEMPLSSWSNLLALFLIKSFFTDYLNRQSIICSEHAILYIKTVFVINCWQIVFVISKKGHQNMLV